jgi:hypothetical protein
MAFFREQKSRHFLEHSAIATQICFADRIRRRMRLAYRRDPALASARKKTIQRLNNCQRL